MGFYLNKMKLVYTIIFIGISTLCFSLPLDSSEGNQLNDEKNNQEQHMFEEADNYIENDLISKDVSENDSCKDHSKFYYECMVKQMQKMCKLVSVQNRMQKTQQSLQLRIVLQLFKIRINI